MMKFIYPWQGGNNGIGKMTGWINQLLFVVRRLVDSGGWRFALDADEGLFVCARMVRSRNCKQKIQNVIIIRNE
jgi:hypothetical protein